jgi:ElaB/YqjD/DUF883 family membrane-anchored ribosome-binding protein
MPVKSEETKISEALEFLNGIASRKMEALQGMVADRYGSLKTALRGAAEGLHDRERRAYTRAAGESTDMVSRVDDSVHRNPWFFLGSTAIGFLVLGLALGRPRR